MSEYKYILVDRIPVPCPDPIAWGKWMSSADLQVALTTFERFTVSTVFLGLDLALGRFEKLFLFETIVYDGVEFNDPERSCTWAEAEATHARVVAEVKERIN